MAGDAVSVAADAPVDPSVDVSEEAAGASEQAETAATRRPKISRVDSSFTGFRALKPANLNRLNLDNPNFNCLDFSHIDVPFLSWRVNAIAIANEQFGQQKRVAPPVEKSATLSMGYTDSISQPQKIDV